MSRKLHSPPTFHKRLGIISYNYDNKQYTAKIADDDRLIDEYHQQEFYNSLQWISYIQRKYPSNDIRPVTTTYHEYVKLMEEHLKSEKLLYSTGVKFRLCKNNEI
jgi:hypothetical protein